MQKIPITLLFLAFSIFTFGNQKDYNIKDFGAVGDGATLNTEVIQIAIDKAHKNGSGKVIIPKGIFLSGSLILKSNVEFYLEEGATLLGSTNPDNYQELHGLYALIVANDQHNISIRGKGVIDGQGLGLALTIDSLHHTGIKIDSAYNYYRMRPGTRPKVIDFAHCKNVEIRGVTIKNSSSWVQNYDQCRNLVIDNIKVESVAYWNNDGIDVSDCKNVQITNCFVNSADDGICLKSVRKEHFNDSVYIANCTIRSSASAIKFGTDSHGGFKNVRIENIKVYDTYRSAIAIESVDGGVLENIVVNNIEATNTGNAIFIRLGRRNTGGEVGTLKNVTIRNVKVEVPFERPDIKYDIRGPALPFFHNPFPSSITGIPGRKVENVMMENIEITYPGRATKGMAYIPVSRLEQVPEKEDGYPEFSMFGELPAWGFYVRHVEGLTMKNITLSLKDEDYRPAFVFDDVSGIKLKKIDIPLEKGRPMIILNNSSKPDIENLTLPDEYIKMQ